MEFREELSALKGKRYDVAISGVWYGENYGSTLTYYALYKVVKELGYSILMIDKARIIENDAELAPGSHSRVFAEKYYDAIAPSLDSTDMRLLNQYCDTFLMGCDQVWNYGIAKNLGFNHYFDFVQDDKRKISYASSFGHAVSFTPPEAISEVTRLFHRFDAISVREYDAVQVLKNEFGVEAVQVLDPVFLVGAKEYETILEEANVKENDRYLLAYILDPTPEIRESLLYAAQKKNLKLIVLLDGRGDFKKNKEIINLPNIVENLNALDWLWYFRNAEFVITDSCHGASFSLIFKKTFICIANRRRGISRFESLVDLFRIRERLIYDPIQIQKSDLLSIDIDYKQIEKILEMECTRSKKWLKEALSLEKKEIQNISCVSKKECCGCGACYNVCPVEAIDMVYDDEGFLYPKINEEKCIHCKKCMKACPSISPVYDNNLEPACYAAYGNDEIREKSSSGGIFSLVAEEILKQGGAICGAAFDEDFRLEQKVIYSQEEMSDLRGSKYIQSNTKKTYLEIKKVLNNGQPALYVGCPCQVAGLKSYLGKDYENLFTIDLLCHGGPSPKAFEKYLDEVHGKKKIKSVGFRDKDYFGWSTEMTVKYSNGDVYRKLRSEDLFYRAFLPCLSVRPHCQVCNYAQLPRQGDFTLGDFWGVAKYNPAFTDGKGTSIVSVNSQKGSCMLAEIRNKLRLLESIDREYILTHGQPYARPFRNNPRRYRFHRLLKKCSFQKAVECCERNEFDFGILGMNADSFGEILSYYALYQIVSNMGYSILMVKRPRELERKITPLKYRLTEFSNRYYPMVSNHESLEKLNLLDKTCGGFILADRKNNSQYNFMNNMNGVLDIDLFSKKYCGLSPVLLADVSIFNELINKVDELKCKDYYVYYLSDNNWEIQEEFDKYASNNHCELLNLSNDMSVEEWLKYIKYAKGIFTDLKDGIDFSIIFKKKYLVIQDNINKELQEYVKKLKIEDHCCKFNEISNAFAVLDMLNEDFIIITEQKKEYLRNLQCILKKKIKQGKGKGSLLKRGTKKTVRFIKHKMPPAIKEKFYPLLKNNRLYNKYLKRL
ncbi:MULTISPECIES: polysaccharide pyruvyl transferase family protein [Blautia]|uniref:polysaccharide pyruvyl transferase family protein n=1 Tax=Blautia TaxID=572511 RepID=UPI000BA2D62D|nr:MULTISPECIES: polysaccharide pyruvyl transferase family protein [Blautia]